MGSYQGYLYFKINKEGGSSIKNIFIIVKKGGIKFRTFKCKF